MEAWIGIGVIAPVIVGLFWGLYKHGSNTDRHPQRRDLVFKEVCEPMMKGMADGMNKDIGALKELMSQRFDSLEDLIKKNGGSHP